jgi:hypothetical protein
MPPASVHSSHIFETASRILCSSKMNLRLAGKIIKLDSLNQLTYNVDYMAACHNIVCLFGTALRFCIIGVSSMAWFSMPGNGNEQVVHSLIHIYNTGETYAGNHQG